MYYEYYGSDIKTSENNFTVGILYNIMFWSENILITLINLYILYMKILIKIIFHTIKYDSNHSNIY